MGNCASAPRSTHFDGTDEESTSDFSDVAVGGARPSVRKKVGDTRRKSHATEQKRDSLTPAPRKSSTRRAMPPVLDIHREVLKKSKTSLDDLLTSKLRNNNWNRKLTDLIVDLESLKVKNVARLASDQARELLRRALTKGSAEDRRIGAYFDQLISMTAKSSTTISASPRITHQSQLSKERDLSVLSEMRKSRFLEIPVLSPTPGSTQSPSNTKAERAAKWNSASALSTDTIGTIAETPSPIPIENGASIDLNAQKVTLLRKDSSDRQRSSEIAKDIEDQTRAMHGLENPGNRIFLSSITRYPGLKNISNWNFDIFGFDKDTQETPLSTLFMYSCSKMNVDSAIAGIDLVKLHEFMRSVERTYGDNVYHNRLHASDVLHSAVNLMRAPYLCENLDVIHRFCLLFASAIHDFRHLGRSNDFLIKTDHQIAAIYNDSSCLENYHASQAFQLLRKPELNFLARVDPKIRIEIRKYTIHSILETDMKKHADHVKDLQLFLEERTDPSQPMLPLKLVSHCLHVCDLSHPTKRFKVHQEWTRRISEEFFQQGDEEEKMGWTPGALFNRKNVNIEKGQIGFIDFIVLPLWVNWTTLTGSHDELVEQIEANKEVWRTKMDAKKIKAKKHRISIETPTRFFSRSSQDFSKSIEHSRSVGSVSSETLNAAPRPPEVTVKPEPMNTLVPKRRPVLREHSDVEQRSKSLSATLTNLSLLAGSSAHAKRHTIGSLELPPVPTRPFPEPKQRTFASLPVGVRKSITPPPPRKPPSPRETKRASTPPPVVYRDDDEDVSLLFDGGMEGTRSRVPTASSRMTDASSSIRLIGCSDELKEPKIAVPKRSRLVLSEVHSMSPSENSPQAKFDGTLTKVVTLPRGSMTDVLNGGSNMNLAVFPGALRPVVQLDMNATDQRSDSDITAEFKKTSPEESMTETPPNARVNERLRFLRDQSLAEQQSRPGSPTGRKRESLLL